MSFSYTWRCLRCHGIFSYATEGVPPAGTCAAKLCRDKPAQYQKIEMPKATQ